MSARAMATLALDASQIGAHSRGVAGGAGLIAAECVFQSLIGSRVSCFFPLCESGWVAQTAIFGSDKFRVVTAADGDAAVKKHGDHYDCKRDFPVHF